MRVLMFGEVKRMGGGGLGVSVVMTYFREMLQWRYSESEPKFEHGESPIQVDPAVTSYKPLSRYASCY
jgi:hypothetical protein